MNVLFTFFAMFFATIARCLPTLPPVFISRLPKTKNSACGGRKGVEPFTKYVCCSSCHYLYHWGDYTIQDTNGLMESKCCTFQQYPNHPQLHRRNKCGNKLMKKVKSPQGKTFFYPRLIYCYCSIIDSLKKMLEKPGFIEKCEKWRDRSIQEGVFCDIYDGRIWNEFMIVDGVPFLSVTFNFALQLNVDWFQPFKHTQHSEGAIYISILNLPRQERYLKENVILVGIIPGPKEPSLHINTFLKPLVDDLQLLWKGIFITNSTLTTTIIRAALLCVACDIPAARKVCGFLGHRATKGCSKCLLSFPTESFSAKPDYSNFDCSQWTPRTNSAHRIEVSKVLECNTKQDRMATERKRSYFDPVRMCIIDPMHNVLLGTSKMVCEVWKCSNVIVEKDFDLIQKKVDSFTCPSTVGRIPSKISSSFSSFTAEQWKNWTIFFSSFALKGILPWNHYNCWLLFVKACFLYCRRSISYSELQEGHRNIIGFSKTFSSLYGSNCCTINMHLHGHLRTCIEDFGPVYSFWCFSYERLNGVLGSYPTNSHHISVQLCRRFLRTKFMRHAIGQMSLNKSTSHFFIVLNIIEDH